MRKFVIVPALLVSAALIGGAGAAPGSSSLHPATQTICLDPGGQSRPAVCQGSASRLDQSYDICLCRSAQRVEAPVCAQGEKAPKESRDYERARKLAAGDGSLVGDLYQGRPMCVEPRNP